MHTMTSADQKPYLQIPLNIDSYDYRAICLFCACLVYALFGSPTPDYISWVEVFVGGMLALSIGVGRVRDALLNPLPRFRFWKTAAQIFMIYGLIIPLIIAAIHGHAASEIIRDVIPFLFLFLPLFLLPLIRERPYYFRSIVLAFILIGLLFSVRSFLTRTGMSCLVWCTDELLYLENMPSVLFTALLLIGTAITYMTRALTLKNTAIFVALILLSLLPIASMVVTVQRASLGAVVLYTIIITAYYIYKAPVRGFNVIIILGIVVAILNISFSTIFESLSSKTQVVGLNMRPQEFEAVWSVVTRDPATFLFGIGWGGNFNSPAVGGLSVNFTHNFFTYIFLKTGCIGVIFCMSYIAGLLERVSRVIFKNIVFGMAILAPLMIDLTLYASFKSLDFGLLLLMISSSLVYFRPRDLNQSEGCHA